MANVTTCPKCGFLYEAWSEEEANDPHRQCHSCTIRENGIGTLCPVLSESGARCLLLDRHNCQHVFPTTYVG